MKGTVSLYSLKGEVIIRGDYRSIEERRMLISVWTGRFHPIGYYFIITPLLPEDIEANKYQPVSRLVRSERPVVPDKKVEIVRPVASYDNKTPFGIADQLHQEDNKIKVPHKKKRKKRIKNYNL